MNPDDPEKERLETEQPTTDYTGDQPQDPGPEDDDRIRPSDRFRVLGRPARYFRWALDKAATTPRPM